MDQDNKPRAPLNLWLMAGEIGIILALPLVILLLIGIKLDARMSTSPLFTIIGLVLAAIVSITAITRKIKRVHV